MRGFSFKNVPIVMLVLLSTTFLASSQLVHFFPFHYGPLGGVSFQTLQFGPPPSPIPAPAPTPPSSATQPSSAALPPPTTIIAPASIPVDRVTQVWEPNVMNSGSLSTGLSEAVKFFMDEQFRVATEHIELTKEQNLIDRSPRSLSEPIISSRSAIIPQLEDEVQASASRSSQDAAQFRPVQFKVDVLSISTASSTPSALDPTPSAIISTPSLPGLQELPSPSMLMSPTVQHQVQENLKNMTQIFSDLKSVFTSPSTPQVTSTPSIASPTPSISNNFPSALSNSNAPNQPAIPPAPPSATPPSNSFAPPSNSFAPPSTSFTQPSTGSTLGALGFGGLGSGGSLGLGGLSNLLDLF